MIVRLCYPSTRLLNQRLLLVACSSHSVRKKWQPAPLPLVGVQSFDHLIPVPLWIWILNSFKSLPLHDAISILPTSWHDVCPRVLGWRRERMELSNQSTKKPSPAITCGGVKTQKRGMLNTHSKLLPAVERTKKHWKQQRQHCERAHLAKVHYS